MMGTAICTKSVDFTSGTKVPNVLVLRRIGEIRGICHDKAKEIIGQLFKQIDEAVWRMYRTMSSVT